MKKILLAASLMLAIHGVQALPTLQLDIGGGTYNNSDQTIYANSQSFTLYALFDPKQGAPGSETFYISAAIVPRLDQTTPPPNVGSFTIGTQTFDAPSMNYGLPPLDVVDGAPHVRDLSPHGVFPTYYAEVGFTFNGQVAPYNTQDDPGGPSAGSGMYYQAFTVNVGNLLGAFSVHFDLYNTKIKEVREGRRLVETITLDDFAPFSHDAQSTPGGGGTPPPVPDASSTVALLGLALIGLAGLRRRFARA